MSSSSTFRYEIASALGLAWDSLRSHKMRSFLTLLGIMIGVASVILVGAAIDGLGIYAEQSTAKAFGSESFLLGQVVSVGNLTRRQLFDKQKYNKTFKMTEERYLESVEGENVMYSPYRNQSSDTRRDNLTSEDTTVIGVAASMIDIRDIVLTEGRFFTPTEERNANYVAVIGDDLRKNLFPEGGSPLGKTFKIQDLDFTVLGVQERLGSSFGRSQDNAAYIPVTVFNRLFGPGNSMAIFARPRPQSGLSMERALDLTRVALRTHFHQKPAEKDRFDVLTPDAVRGFIDQLLSMVALVVIPVTLISLVVGGIVIMNIMLVSVTERTREIGIRKALGARQSDLMRQILIEALIMAVAGGAAGVAIGAVLTTIFSLVFGVPLRVPPFYVALSVFVSGAVGLISGWYPASRAAKLDPIVALRAE
jgi:putative ABC transport system permease protein